MRIRKIVRGAFYTNTGITSSFLAGNLSLTAIDTDWYIYYTDENSDTWKIAPTGTTYATTGPILSDSTTTSIVVTPTGGTASTTGATQQLAVVNQDSVNVITECTFASDDEAVATVSAAGLVTYVGNIGTATVTATHNDGPTDTYAAEFV